MSRNNGSTSLEDRRGDAASSTSIADTALSKTSINGRLRPNDVNDASTNEDANSPTKTKPIQEAATIEEVRAALKDLQAKKSEATVHLDASIGQHDDFLRQLRRLDLSRARVGSIAVGARTISREMLAEPAATAGRISSAVERLDLEQSRVKATLDVVEQLSELKACVLGVVGSMGAPQDWETAAEYISRASKVSLEVLDSGFAEKLVPTAEVPDPPKVTLDNAAQSLCDLFMREFNKAVEQSDGAGITRFFKMFPLIGRSKEGLDAYGKYVCQGVSLRARVRLQTVSTASRHDGTVYVNALTKLFEHIAQVIEGHSGLVERHYGSGTMIKVMERLHREADMQAGIILDTWNDERAISRKLTDVKSYAFSFLVQSFLPASRGTGAAGTPRSQSPANRSAASDAQATQAGTDGSVEMKEIDKIINEIVSMISHWSLYVRFMSSRSMASEHEELSIEPLKIPEFVTDSNLPRKVTKILLEPFAVLAMFFLRRSVEKAFELDESPSGLTLNPKKPITASAPFITSAVDDVMYVVSQMLQKALATSQVDSVLAVISTIGRVLGSDFIGMIQRKMRDQHYPKAAIQGAVPPEDLVLSFLVLINNLDIATEYVHRIINSHVETEDLADDASQSSNATRNEGRTAGRTRPLTELFPMGRDAATVRTGLVNAESMFNSKATELLNDGISVAFTQVVKPRLRPLLADAFRDVDYAASAAHPASSYHRAADTYDSSDFDADSDFGESSGATGRGSVKHRTGMAWDAILRPLKRVLTDKGYDRLLSVTVAYLASLLEKRIWSYHGRVGELGAIRLERDINDIANIVTRSGGGSGGGGAGGVGASGGWSSGSVSVFRLRAHFGKCLEIVMLMNLDEEEWVQVQEDLAKPAGGMGNSSTTGAASGVSSEGSKLSEAERERARTMIKGSE